MADVSRMLAKNLLPRPSPLLAPATSPAMSTISTVAGITRLGLSISASRASRSSGTFTTPTFGSIVQNGKFAACAFALERQLKSVDFPTLGRPTMPHCKPIPYSFPYFFPEYTYPLPRRALRQCLRRSSTIVAPYPYSLKEAS